MPTPKVPRTAPLHSHFRLPETRRDGKLLQKTQALLEYARREMKDLHPADIVFTSRVVDNAGELLNFVHHGGVTVQQRPIYEELAIQHQAQVERLVDWDVEGLRQRVNESQSDPFIFAGLLASGLVRPDPDRPGQYLPCGGLEAFANGRGVVHVADERPRIDRFGDPRAVEPLPTEFENEGQVMMAVIAGVATPRRQAVDLAREMRSTDEALAKAGLTRAQVDACLERLQRHGYRPEHNDYTGWEASLSLVLHGVNIRLHRITERSPEGTPTAFGPIVTLRSIDGLFALAQKCRAG